uniref:ionotropic receptor 165 precursor n=1 Tax=Aedes aegypti TaxID=7159 RepID=UPI000C255330|nr:ionotropic receptor 165 precursor [Aedes aegypti]
MRAYLNVVLFLYVLQTSAEDLHGNVFRLITDVIHRMDNSGHGVHDIGIACIDRSILKDTELHLLPFADVTYQLLSDDVLRTLTTPNKLSLLLLDIESFVDSSELFQFMGDLADTGLWSYSTAVVMFSRTLTPVKTMRRIGAVNLLLVLITESRLQTFILNFLTNSLHAVPIASASHLLFSSKVHNLNGYQLETYMDTASKPFHIYHNATLAEGIDVELLEIVIAHLNGTVRYSKSYKTLLTWIYKTTKEQGLSHPMFDISLYHMQRIPKIPSERLYLPFREEFCISAPKQRRRILFLQLTRPFNVPVWILVGFFSVFRLKLKWKMLSITPKTKVIAGCVRASFLVLEFVLIEAYLSKVIANLATMQYEPDPKTLEHLNQRRQPFLASNSELPFLTEYPELQLTISTKRREIFIRTHAFMISCKVAEYWGNSERNFDPVSNDRFVVILEERVRSIVRTISFRRFSPFIERFSECFGRLVDAGIWSKVYNRWSSKGERLKLILSRGDEAFKLEDLLSVWISAAVGYSVALIAFGTEMVYFIIRARRVHVE